MNRRLLSAAALMGLILGGGQIVRAQDAAGKPGKVEPAEAVSPEETLASSDDSPKAEEPEKPVTKPVKSKKGPDGESAASKDPAGEGDESETGEKEPPVAEIEIDRKTFTNGLGMEMVWIDAEENEAGGFWVSKYEVTQEDFSAVGKVFAERFPTLPGMSENPSKFKNGGAYPVEHVSWQDSVKFCLALTEAEREVEESVHPGEAFHYSLPTVDEWLVFSSGAESEPSGPSNLEREPREVGTVGKESGAGLFDVLGNVAEWCLDLYEPVLNSDTELVERYPALFSPKENARAVVGVTLLSAEKDNPFQVASTITRAVPSSPETAGNVGFRVVLIWGGVPDGEGDEKNPENDQGDSDPEASEEAPSSGEVEKPGADPGTSEKPGN